MGADSYDEMHRFLSGDDSCDRLLSGRLSPLDAPESLRGVAALFEAAAGPAAPEELGSKGQVVAALTAEVLSSQPQLQTTLSRKRAMLSKLLTAKFAAAATVAAFGLGTAAAAATGSLPGQTSNADINTTTTTSPTTAAANQQSSGPVTSGQLASSADSSSSIPATGPANSHAQYGLCTAFLAAGNNQASTSGGSTQSTPPQYNSTAFKALIGEHSGVAGTTTYCQGIVTSSSSSTDQTNGTGKPADTGKPSDTGKPTDAGTPPNSVGSAHVHGSVTTPNSGGTGTASTASGGLSTPGASIAGAASNGASSAGSGNATSHP